MQCWVEVGFEWLARSSLNWARLLLKTVMDGAYGGEKAEKMGGMKTSR